mgnify:CR=1 FL=1
MAYRDFDAEVAERAREREPLEFTLGGSRFTCKPVCPFGAALDLAAAPELHADLAGAVAGLVAFFEQVVVDDQVGEVADAVRRVNADVAYACVVWLSEEFSGRPTKPSSESAVSPLPDGRDSSSEPGDTATAA